MDIELNQQLPGIVYYIHLFLYIYVNMLIRHVNIYINISGLKELIVFYITKKEKKKSNRTKYVMKESPISYENTSAVCYIRYIIVRPIYRPPPYISIITTFAS